MDRSREATYKEYLKEELEAAAMYRVLAAAERDPDRSKIFEDLVEAELRHASRWAEKLDMDVSSLEPAPDDLRLRIFKLVTRLIGTTRVVPWLVRTEAKEISAYAADPEAADLVPEERRHAQVLTDMTSGPAGSLLHDAGSFRAAVLGVNDGLVSNFSLVMGVAGGTSNQDIVLLAGVAGLLAGAFSMAAGEYISMRSQSDLYEHLIAREEIELRDWPEEEEEELALIYQAKGLPKDESERIAKQIMAQPDVALETMAREELGLDPSKLGSPWRAAASSFVAFVAGASVPILPYVFDAGDLAFALSGIFGASALLVVGGLLAGLTGKSVRWGALRMLLAGGAAASVTYAVGSLIGVTLVG